MSIRSLFRRAPKRRAALAAAVTIGTLMVGGVPTASAAPPELVFNEEFNGTSLNTRVWKPYHNTYGTGNNELQCYTPGNVSVSGGTLKMTARRQSVSCPGGGTRAFTSGFLGTRETGTYFPRFGRYEMRARLPHGQGLWPAFWLRHRDGAGVGEVDVMEYFHSQVPGRYTASLHLDHRPNISKRADFFENPTSNPGWHVWAVDILPVSNGVRFVFSVDGRTVHTYTDTQRRWASAHPGKGIWDIALNLSVGGNWAGRPDDSLGYLRDINRCAQSGTAPNGCSSNNIRRAAFPSTYEIDYVRVWTK
jgi:beta-glucanase (GH16 family)